MVTAVFYFAIQDHVLLVPRWFKRGVIVVLSLLLHDVAVLRNGHVVNRVASCFPVDITSAEVLAMLDLALLALSKVPSHVTVDEIFRPDLVLSQTGYVLRFVEKVLNVATILVLIFVIVVTAHHVRGRGNERVPVVKQRSTCRVLKMSYFVVIHVNWCCLVATITALGGVTLGRVRFADRW